ncbi:MAG TPA: hypothetical protein VGR28_13980 [Candidatus Thermoplasmatota archaeon]|jgi:hypothetical protein|nr:hypothetical protein [Candidatus Thermoplasmatota archaeon]
MERLDAIVAGIGVLVVAVALGGVVATGPPAGAGSFAIAFLEQRQDLAPASGQGAGDGAVEVPVAVALRNLTTLTFSVRVAGAGPRLAPDTIQVTVTAPNGTTYRASPAQLPGPGAQAEVTVPVEARVQAAPPAATIRAASQAAALAAAGAPTTNGTGNWTVTVGIAGGAPVHAESHTVTVNVAASTYRAVPQPDVANPR